MYNSISLKFLNILYRRLDMQEKRFECDFMTIFRKMLKSDDNVFVDKTSFSVMKPIDISSIRLNSDNVVISVIEIKT